MKNKFNETGTDLGKDSSMTKITNDSFSDTPNKAVIEMLRWADPVAMRADIAEIQQAMQLYSKLLKGGEMGNDY